MNTLLRYLVFISFMLLIIIIVSGVMPAFLDFASGVKKVSKIMVHTELSVDSNLLSGVTSVDSIIEELKSADADPGIDAILLDINSGGGGVVASYELAHAIQKVSKPVVAVIREAGASGAYWAAISGDYVIANEVSIVGSVGVFGSYLVFEELMDKYGVEEVRAVSGELKDFGSPFRNLTEREVEELDKIINTTFQVFFNDFKRLRSVNESVLDEVVTGRIFLGLEAYDFGLVDALGGFEEADEYLKALLGSDNIEYVERSSSISFLDLLSSVKDSYNPLSGLSEGFTLNS